jgi:4-hydroxy-tetrahydrodipicolinate reductase
MSPRRLAIVGMGKMGHAIAELAPSSGFEVVARLDQAETIAGLTKQILHGADVAVEFTTPEAAPANIRGLIAAGCPVVAGTTGWYDALDAIRRDVNASNGALLTATNFSLGVNIFERIVARAAELMADVPGFDAHMIETHHNAKKDAPSGTALTLANAAKAAGGRPIPITSVRVGSVPGIHEVIYDAQFEQIRLQHVARDRRVFAEGALVAAAWLIGRRGCFTMKDVLDTPNHG